MEIGSRSEGKNNFKRREKKKNGKNFHFDVRISRERRKEEKKPIETQTQTVPARFEFLARLYSASIRPNYSRDGMLCAVLPEKQPKTHHQAPALHCCVRAREAKEGRPGVSFPGLLAAAFTCVCRSVC